MSIHPTSARLAGLDGLRAIAVTLVLIFHLFPQALPGGFLGVDVFFVISGFLIASLLLREKARTGRINLVAFWQRRARRLLPALGIMLLVCTTVAYFVSAELMINIAAQLAGAAAFVANWVYIALGSNYFARDDSELFRNTWSLGIEEQFYLLLPLALLFTLRMRSKLSRTLIFAAAGIGSALWMLTLAQSETSASRVYFGTDTHAFGLLLGVALACAAQRTDGGGGSRADAVSAKDAAARTTLTPARQALLAALGSIGLGTLAWLAFTLREGSPESFTWGFQLATAAVLLTIWAATRAGSWLGRALDVAPLRWVGERSYGLYLWHWPLLLIIAAGVGPSGIPAWIVPISTLVLTVAIATLSYRFVEQPIRRVGLRAALRSLVRPARLQRGRLALGVTMILMFAITLPTTAVALATAPAPLRSEEQLALEKLEAAARLQNDAEGEPDVSGKNEEATASPHTGGDAELSGAGAALDPSQSGLIGTDWTNPPVFEIPLPDPIEGNEIFAVGDSVMLASYDALTKKFPDIRVDADVSRGLEAGIEIVRDRKNTGKLRPVLVVGLGTNGPIDDDELRSLRRAAGDRGIVLVNAHGDRDWIKGVNKQLKAFADTHRGVTLADWDAAISEHPDGLYGDGIHPDQAGGKVYARAVQDALDALITREEQPTT